MAAPEETESLEQLSLELKSKKKKKKKVDITSLESDLAGLAAIQPQNATGHDGLPATDNSDSAPLSSSGVTSKEPMKDLVNETDLDLYLSTSKKKKKKAPKINELVAVESIDQPLQVSEPPALSASAVVAPKPSETSPVSYDYSLPLKKRKRKADITFEGYHEVLAEEGVEVVKDDAMDGDDDIDLMDTSSWAGSDRDYTYDELLERVFNIMRQKNPSMVDRKTKLVMKPPQVMRVGAKRTSFANFPEICKLLHRQPKHLLAFLLAELGTNGSIDGNNQLIIKGRFQQKQIETVLRRYIKEYVTCHTCRSPDTSLQRENRLFFLQCGTCGSRCTVENVKSGFQAVTNRRAIRQQQ